MRNKIDISKPVKVYRNLHKGCWSVLQTKNKRERVVAHLKQIQLKDCKFVVQPKGNQTVRERKRKHVHAYIKGYVIDRIPSGVHCGKFVTYDPYKHTSFVIGLNGKPVLSAECVDMYFEENSTKVMAYGKSLHI